MPVETFLFDPVVPGILNTFAGLTATAAAERLIKAQRELTETTTAIALTTGNSIVATTAGQKLQGFASSTEAAEAALEAALAAGKKCVGVTLHLYAEDRATSGVCAVFGFSTSGGITIKTIEVELTKEKPVWKKLAITKAEAEAAITSVTKLREIAYLLEKKSGKETWFGAVYCAVEIDMPEPALSRPLPMLV